MKHPQKLLLILFAATVVTLVGERPTEAAGPWYVSTAGNDLNDCLSTATSCLTITGAIGKASPGDTVNVAAGTYNEQVQIAKTITLLGAKNGVDARTRSGLESIIDNTCGAVQIMADNVTLDGFTIQGSTLTDPCFLSGIWTNPGYSGTNGGHQILNNIVQNNISGIELDSTCTYPTLVKFNLIQNNNNPGPGSANAIQTNFGLCNADIVSNKFSGHSNASVLIPGVPSDDINVTNNELVGGTSERIVWGNVTNSAISGNKSVGSTAINGTIRLFGGNSNISVTSNNLSTGVRGIRVDDPFMIGPNSAITAHNNCIAGNTTAGLQVDAGGHSGSLNADANWWGAADGPSGTGPGSGDAIVDPDSVVVFSPFLIAPASPCVVPPVPLGNFRDVRRNSEINVGPDLGDGGDTSMNFTGSTGSASDTWITVYDETPIDNSVQNTYGSVSLSADVLIHKFNNKKGGGLLALYNEAPPTTRKGFALIVFDAGNTDTLVLNTVNQAGQITPLKTVALGAGIAEDAWYRVTMDVVVTGTSVTVTGKVVKHTTASNPNSATGAQVGTTLSFSGLLVPTPIGTGVETIGEVGIVAAATSAVVDTSVTNFAITTP